MARNWRRLFQNGWDTSLQHEDGYYSTAKGDLSAAEDMEKYAAPYPH